MRTFIYRIARLLKPVYELSPAKERDAIDAFARVFYDVRNAHLLSFLGAECLKNPFDLWMYQEIIWRCRPRTVIECGSGKGGSALYMATIFDCIGDGKVISINKRLEASLPAHRRIRYLRGSSTDCGVIVDAIRDAPVPIMVILDSDHSKNHVLTELDGWHRHVSRGQYLIVEDTNVNGHPVFPTHGPGPMEAVREWLPSHPEFKVDRACERFLFTYNPGGYLLKS